MCSEVVVQQAFRFELDPNREQRVLLAKSVGASRYVYNWGLAESRRAYELTGKRPRLEELKARLVELKKGECPWLYVGVDLGLRAAAVIHDGTQTRVVEPQQALRRSLAKLRRLDRQLARKQRGSRNRAKANLRRARLHYKISCRRRDFLHQLSSSLARTKSVVVLEDLHVRGMQRNRHLALSIGDAGMDELRCQLAYKSAWYGSTLVVADRFYPSSKLCSRCGMIADTLSLGERILDCDACGLSLDRDENAAINLRRLGLAQLPEGLREVTPVKRKALASAPAKVKPASEKQEATAKGARRSTRRSAPKGVLVSA